MARGGGRVSIGLMGTTMRAVRYHEAGGPAVFRVEEIHQAERLLPLPEGVGFEAGATLPLQP